MPLQKSPLPPSVRLTRLRALRAIMDGRGVDTVILGDPANVAHYADIMPGTGVALIVFASGALLIGAGADGGAEGGLQSLPGGWAQVPGALPVRLRHAGVDGAAAARVVPGGAAVTDLRALIAQQRRAAEAAEAHEKGPVPEGRGLSGLSGDGA